MSTLRRSITGYGAGTAETTEFCVTVEIKAVNQRFLEISPHMPRAFGAWENDLRDLIRTPSFSGASTARATFPRAA